MNILPSFEDFHKLAQDHTHVPLVYEFSGDFDTPVGLYEKIRKESPYSFLLESAMQSGSSGRYSFLGCNPTVVIRAKNKALTITENGSSRRVEQEPVQFLREFMAHYSVAPVENLPPFAGGLVGYISYDSVRMFEKLPDSTKNDLDVDDISLMLVENLIVYDHFRHSIKIIVLADVRERTKGSYSRGCDLIHSTAQLLKRPLQLGYEELDVKKGDSIKITTNISKDLFEHNVVKAKKYITEGDIFQVVLSQRMSVKIDCDAFTIYRNLRRMNPSPYMFYCVFEDVIITGSSPEVLVKCNNGFVTSRPLAGTRKRGSTEHDDRRIADELLKDEKERAEHVMLVDLARNDLGRFCKYGSISVPEFMGIERFSHVMHIVSEVTGRLDESKDPFDVLAASLPAGTVSGAPKIRAMEIIDEFESSRRGVYAGAVGYFDFKKSMDMCIAIRTLLIKDNTAYIQAGAGIVADSSPENEYFETLQKAKVLLDAVAAAEGKSHDFSD